MLQLDSIYSRKNNIVYDEQGTIVVTLKQKFPDIEKLNLETINYTNRYCEMFPQFCEISVKENLSQLTLF